MENIKLIAFNMYDTWIDRPWKSNPYKVVFDKLWIEETRKSLAYQLVTSSQDMQEILPPQIQEHKNFKEILHECELHIQKELATLSIYPDFFPIVDLLKKNGYQTAVISNLAKPYSAILAQDNLQWIFDYKILSYEVGLRKPEKEIFQLLQKQSWIKPEEMLMVGDSLTSDVQWAKNAWMQAIHLKRNTSEIQKNEGYISISTLSQLAHILRLK